MNRFAPSRYDELVTRLALGLEPLDAWTGERVAARLDVRVAGEPYVPRRRAFDPPARVQRHGSCRYVLVYDETLETPVEVRIFDRFRRYVGRRLSVPITELADVLAAEEIGADVPARRRVWRPVLFPAAAYPVAAVSTGLRGRLRVGGEPARWARVEARVNGDVAGRGQADDRGEFLLTLRALPALLTTLPRTIDIVLAARAPDPPEPRDPEDPAAELPLESAAAPGAADPVSAGTGPNWLSGAFDPGIARNFPVTLNVGRLTSGLPPFDL